MVHYIAATPNFGLRIPTRKIKHLEIYVLRSSGVAVSASEQRRDYNVKSCRLITGKVFCLNNVPVSFRS
jgi:hypothetical protein